MLKVGRRAPDFDLPTTLGAGMPQARVSLADFDDRWLALVFYPRDFSLVCPTELTALSARIGDFEARDCSLLGVSTDTLDTHDRWISTPGMQGGLGGLEFPLASDANGVAATAYGVYQKRQGVCLRGLFIIDPNGVLQYQAVNSMAVGRRADDVLRVLAALDSGGMCPSDWSAGTAPIDAAAVLRPGNMFANYKIESQVGAGSFGTVFRARDTTLDRTVALKVFKVETARRWETVLQEARAARISHGDLKPANVMITAQGIVKIMDFGLARRAPKPSPAVASGPADATLLTTPKTSPEADATVALPTENSIITGTPAYMAPEMTRGVPSTSASDCFAYGVILREMLTGERLFQGAGPIEIFEQINSLDPDAATADLPSAFAGAVRGALARDPGQRPAMAELEAHFADPAVSA